MLTYVISSLLYLDHTDVKYLGLAAASNHEHGQQRTHRAPTRRLGLRQVRLSQLAASARLPDMFPLRRGQRRLGQRGAARGEDGIRCCDVYGDGTWVWDRHSPAEWALRPTAAGTCKTAQRKSVWAPATPADVDCVLAFVRVWLGIRLGFVGPWLWRGEHCVPDASKPSKLRSSLFLFGGHAPSVVTFKRSGSCGAESEPGRDAVPLAAPTLVP